MRLATALPTNIIHHSRVEPTVPTVYTTVPTVYTTVPTADAKFDSRAVHSDYTWRVSGYKIN